MLPISRTSMLARYGATTLRLTSYNRIWMGINVLNQLSVQLPNPNLSIIRQASGCPLKKINNLFNDAYSSLKSLTKRELGKKKPVIIMHGDNLVLYYQGSRQSWQYIPDKYHSLKEIAHISCLIHTIVRLRKEGQYEKAENARTVALEAVEQILKEMSPELLQYLHIVDTCHTLLQKNEDDNIIKELSSLKKYLESLIEDAAKMRLTALHLRVIEIKKMIHESAWGSLAVVVMGPPLPREGELSMQYFHNELKPIMEKCPHGGMSLTNALHISNGQRLIYAESINSEDEAMSLLTTYICDEDMGGAILEDKNAMRADFLMKATRKLLPRITSTS